MKVHQATKDVREAEEAMQVAVDRLNTANRIAINGKTTLLHIMLQNEIQQATGLRDRINAIRQACEQQH